MSLSEEQKLSWKIWLSRKKAVETWANFHSSNIFFFLWENTNFSTLPLTSPFLHPSHYFKLEHVLVKILWLQVVPSVVPSVWGGMAKFSNRLQVETWQRETDIQGRNQPYVIWKQPVSNLLFARSSGKKANLNGLTWLQNTHILPVQNLPLIQLMFFFPEYFLRVKCGIITNKNIAIDWL